jgi:uncharacterized protein
MRDIKIQWDDNNNLLNERKHGVSFEQASTVFSDEYALLL